jgi:menaquinone-dependent protoporphyrinogen oxidase
MKVLVAYATRHGATQGIADRIATVLRSRGLPVDLRSVAEIDRADRLTDYDAFVVGGAAYFGRWLKEASSFVRAHAAVLDDHPTWLFSSGPIGTERINKHGKDVVAASIPVEFTELQAEVHPREEHVFFGAMDLDGKPQGFAEVLMSRIVNLLPAAREAMPSGDFRDWPEIELWATQIAMALGEAPTVVAST